MDIVVPPPAALKGFFLMSGRWGLSRAQERVLLATSESTLHRWRREPESADPSSDQMERISYVLGIFNDLHRILGDVPFADEWVKRPNLDFGDDAPLNRMLAGNVGDLAFVRTYVDRWAEGW
jgi:uncharacterized protein (DUF2384 family)